VQVQAWQVPIRFGVDDQSIVSSVSES